AGGAVGIEDDERALGVGALEGAGEPAPLQVVRGREPRLARPDHDDRGVAGGAHTPCNAPPRAFLPPGPARAPPRPAPLRGTDRATHPAHRRWFHRDRYLSGGRARRTAWRFGVPG